MGTRAGDVLHPDESAGPEDVSMQRAASGVTGGNARRRFGRGAFRGSGVAVSGWLVGLLVLLASSPLALAAAPVVLGPGNTPGVAVNGAGTGFIAYNDNDNTTLPANAVVHYCRLPRGATACDVKLDFGFPGTTGSRPQVFVAGQTVRILAYRYALPGTDFALDFVLASTDGGLRFTAPVAVGTLAPYAAVAGPGPTGISLVTDANANTPYQRVDANGPLTHAEADLGTQYPYTSAVGLVNPTTPLVTFSAGDGTAAFRVFGGSGDVNDAANWSPAQVIGPGSYGRLAGGPSGLFSQMTADNPKRLDLRRYNGSVFGTPVSIRIGDGGASNYLTQDAGGTLFSLWPDNTCSPGCPKLRYATSPDGASWRTADLLALNQQINNPWAAVAADHRGYAVIDTGQGTARQVYAVPLASTSGSAPPATGSLPPPVFGKSVDAVTVSGTVSVLLPGTGRVAQAHAGVTKGVGFVPLTRARQLPVGTIFDTTNGVARLTSATAARGKLQAGDFGAGLFKVLQRRRERGLTEMRLVVSSSARKTCGKAGKAQTSAKRTLPATVLTQLRATATGRFRTRGRYSSATVRGTSWTTTDRCDGTLTQVQRGTVIVADLRLHKNILLQAGGNYLAKAP